MKSHSPLILLLFWVSCVAARPPNIILILADDFGWRDSSAYGSEFYQTPGIERLAREGVRFTDAYAANPLCSPTRASILTGQYPGRLNFTAASGHEESVILEPHASKRAAPDKPATVPQSRTRLPIEYVTYAELLCEAGYATAFMGKWHLGREPYLPENQGFETVVGGRQHPGPPPPGRYFAPWNVDTLKDFPDGTHITDALTDKALEFIESHRGEPFLLNLWFYDVHAPFQAKPELIDKYENCREPGYPPNSPTMAAMIESMDHSILRILDALDRLGLREETIVIFTSDNGGNDYDEVAGVPATSNAPLRAGKGNNYEGGVRVPLIVCWPGVSQPGAINESVVVSVDLYPTILHMAGLPLHPSEHLDGVDFTSAIEGKPFDRGPSFWDFPHYISMTGSIPNSSVREGYYKLYRFYYDGPEQTHRYELYDLKEDISESHNLAEAMPEKVAAMDALIERHLQESQVLHPNKNPDYRDSSEDSVSSK